MSQSNFWQHLPKYFSVLAPMEGVTDLIFRQVIARAGKPDVFFTEFTNVSSYAAEAGRHNALERLKIVPTDHPIVAQIWGKNPNHFAMLAAELENLGFDGLDLNMGCPDRHVNKAGGGAAMIKTPELALECIKMAKRSTDLPISVKTRLGFSFVEEYKQWIPLILQQELAAFTIHLRTRKEMSKVSAHYELIPEIIALRNQIAPQTKLIINGDIKNLTDIRTLSAKYPEIDGFMIGRGVFSNPFCFTNKVPTKSELFALLDLHLNLFDEYTENIAPRSFEPLKRFFKVYIHSFAGASELREKLMHCKTTQEVRAILQAS